LLLLLPLLMLLFVVLLLLPSWCWILQELLSCWPGCQPAALGCYLLLLLLVADVLQG
jgi:hypothetical protein